jgi:hypothetical protein
MRLRWCSVVLILRVKGTAPIGDPQSRSTQYLLFKGVEMRAAKSFEELPAAHKSVRQTFHEGLQPWRAYGGEGRERGEHPLHNIFLLLIVFLGSTFFIHSSRVPLCEFACGPLENVFEYF